MDSSPPSTIGDKSTSDLVVRIRTHEGRDEWIYCHSDILMKKSNYFADRLSNTWPTCQILDSRTCVEVLCQEADFDHHVTVLRLLYAAATDLTMAADACSNVKNALGMLRVAVFLGSPEIVSICVGYLEAVPWEESEEEEILKTVPNMGPQAESVLGRLRPVCRPTVAKVFLSALRFATSSPPTSMNDLKVLAQEQLEYMLAEDDDAPLLTAEEDGIKLEVRTHVSGLLARFVKVTENGESEGFQSYLPDLSWAFQIMTRLEIPSDFVLVWVEVSVNVIKIAESASLEVRLKTLEVTNRVFEIIGYATVVLPALKRLHVVKTWLPFVRIVKGLVDSTIPRDDDDAEKTDDAETKADQGEMWQSLEAAFVTIIMTLPSSDQAEILTDWLGDEGIGYPDLTEAFEVWCYRSKVAKRRMMGFSDENKAAAATITKRV